MEPIRQAGIRSGSPRAACRLIVFATVASLAACSADLSPEKSLISTSIELAGTATHELTIDVPANAPILITVSGHAVDVKTSVAAANDSSGVFADAPNRRMGVETLFVEAAQARSLTIRIARNDHSAARGRVDVTAVALPLATDSDRRRLEAARSDAMACLSYANIQHGRASADAFAEAARLHAGNDDHYREGLARLHAAGVHYTRLADWAGTVELASQAVSALERAAEQIGRAHV